MRARVDGFLRACERSRFEPHFVIDAGWKSEEAGRKWTERREKEVRGGRRDIPLSADTFLADALHASGAKVYTVEGTDGDDVIARLAHELSASEPGAPSALVLSADRDMFRYDDLIPNAPERVFADFSFVVAAAAAAAGGRASSVGGRPHLNASDTTADISSDALSNTREHSSAIPGREYGDGGVGGGGVVGVVGVRLNADAALGVGGSAPRGYESYSARASVSVSSSSSSSSSESS
jgi:hypothetical protein